MSRTIYRQTTPILDPLRNSVFHPPSPTADQGIVATDGGATADTLVLTSKQVVLVESGVGQDTIARSTGQRFIAQILGSGQLQYWADAGGQPIFPVGDTVWNLAVNAGNAGGAVTWQSDIDNYMSIRAGQGFNMCEVGAMGITENDGSTWDGLLPFVGGEPANLNNTYWQRVDYLLSAAETNGITVFLNICFNDGRALNGKTTTQCQNYGVAVGNRYKARPNLQWMVGDDIDNSNQTMFTNVLTGIRSAGDTHYVSIQNMVEGTSRYNAYYGDTYTWGVANAQYNWTYSRGTQFDIIEYAYAESSPLLVMRGDGTYSDRTGSGVDTSILWRNRFWWSFSSGTRGFNNGTEGTWQWFSGPPPPLDNLTNNVQETDFCAAAATFTDLTNWHQLLPDVNSSFVTAGRGTHPAHWQPDIGDYAGGTTYVTASVTPDGTLAVVYIPSNAASITVTPTELATPYTVSWIDPANGTKTGTSIAGTYRNTNSNSAGAGDWVLVFEAAPATPKTLADSGSGSDRLTITSAVRFADSAAAAGQFTHTQSTALLHAVRSGPAGDPAGTAAFETWKGGPQLDYVVDFCAQHTGNWSDIATPDWLIDGWAGDPRNHKLMLSVPMLPGGGTTLAAGAAGSYDSYFATLAGRLIAAGFADAIIRLGWEMDGDWFDWTIQVANGPADYITFWRRIRGVMLGVGGAAFTFNWCPNNGRGAGSPAEDCYPGDAYVDQIGVDAYDYCWTTTTRVTDVNVRWAAVATGDHCLNFWAAFADSHNKPIGLPEWGLKSDALYGGGDNPYYVNQIFAWLAANGATFEAYFDAADSIISNDQFPNGGAAYRANENATSETKTLSDAGAATSTLNVAVSGDGGTVTLDAVGPSAAGQKNDGNGGALANWDHTISGTGTLLLVGVGAGASDSDASTTTTVTFGGTGMTSAAKVHENNGASGYIEIFKMVGPPTGTRAVAVTYGGTGTILNRAGGSLSFNGVDQTTPLSTPATAAGAGTTAAPASPISSATGNVVVSFGSNGQAINSATNATIQFNAQIGNGWTAMDGIAGATSPGAATVSPSFNLTSDWWSYIGFDVKAGVAATADKELDDAGTGSDNLTVAAAATCADSAAASDSLTVSKTVGFADAGSATTAITSAAAVAFTDAAAAAETLTTAAAVGFTDAGTGTTTVATTAAALLSDAGNAVDAITATVTTTLSDAAIGDGVLTTSQGSIVSDEGAATDRITTTAATAVADTAICSDGLAVDQGTTPKTLADSATGVETITSAATTTIVDSGASTTTISSAAAIRFADTSVAADVVGLSITGGGGAVFAPHGIGVTVVVKSGGSAATLLTGGAPTTTVLGPNGQSTATAQGNTGQSQAVAR